MKTVYLPALLALIYPLLVQAAPNPENLAKDQWFELKSQNFHVVTNANEAVSRKLVRDLEIFRFFIPRIQKLNLMPDIKPFRILAVSGRSGFLELGLPDSIDGVFIESLDGPYAIVNVKGYETDSDETSGGKHNLLHEYVHYMARSTQPRMYYPRWYEEGMADYLATFRFYEDKNEIVIGDPEVMGNSIDYSLNQGRGSLKKVDVEDLFKITALDPNSDERDEKFKFAAFYGRSASTVHYLNSSAENQQALKGYLSFYNEGFDVDSSFKKAFSRSYEQLDREIQKYVNGKDMVARTISVGKNFKLPEFPVLFGKLKEPDFYYHMTDFLMRFGSSDVPLQAQIDLLKRSIKDGPQYPERKVALAELTFEEKGLPEAKDMILSILREAPENVAAMAFYGDILFEEASLKRRVGLSDWEKVLDAACSQYRKLIKADPANGHAYYKLGKSHTLRLDDKFSNEGMVALDSARFFSSDKDLYWDEAKLRLRIHDNENAISLLRRYSDLSGGYNLEVTELHELRQLLKMEVKPEKAGRYVYQDGSVYEGEWQDGKPQGTGTVKRSGGASYTGQWQNGLIHGNGEFTSSNGYKCIMQFKDGEATGNGELRFSGDDGYKGQLMNGFTHGLGERHYVSGAKDYGKHIGGFWLGRRHGPGTYYWPTGESYKGEWVFGRVKITLPGMVYVGDVNEKGQPEGKGDCYYPESGKIEECSFTDGKLECPVESKGYDGDQRSDICRKS